MYKTLSGDRADLVDYFMKEKERIKNKPGVRSKRDRKILAIRDYGIFRAEDTVSTL
jgi:hypothetical protein